jgi:hypothetical protein
MYRLNHNQDIGELLLKLQEYEQDKIGGTP